MKFESLASLIRRKNFSGMNRLKNAKAVVSFYLVDNERNVLVMFGKFGVRDKDQKSTIHVLLDGSAKAMDMCFDAVKQQADSDAC